VELLTARSVSSTTFTNAALATVLEQLNGQTLVRADWAANNQLVLSFREGACIMASISAAFDPDCMMWWLLQTDGVEVSFDGYGMLDISYPT
jgi:hypothetical protein